MKNSVTATPSQYLSNDPSYILHLSGDHKDSSHVIVSSLSAKGGNEIIGHIYISDSDSGPLYQATDIDGEELSVPTQNFNEVESQFDKHARRLMDSRESKVLTNQSIPINLTNNNKNQMKNSNNTIAKSKKENQLIFVEYEKPTKEGHLITVVDSYHNTIGRIHRSYNEQTKKYEFTAYDHAEKPLYMKSEKVWELKNQFTSNRSELLEQAHQRRIESKENSRSNAVQTQSAEKKTDDRKVESGKNRQDKPADDKDKAFNPNEREEKNQVTMEETEQAIREHELDSIRDQENGREDTMER